MSGVAGDDTLQVVGEENFPALDTGSVEDALCDSKLPLLVTFRVVHADPVLILRQRKIGIVFEVVITMEVHMRATDSQGRRRIRIGAGLELLA